MVRLICSWDMKICLRKEARISTERLISVQTDVQTEIHMAMYMAEHVQVKSVYVQALWPRESINQVLEISKVTFFVDVSES
jgi:hypothetical protein